QGCLILVGFNKASRFPGKDLVELTTIGNYFTPHQVESLNTVGAFIDLGDPHIAYQLLLAPFTDVTVTAKHLLTQNTAVKAAIGHKCLGNRGQQGHHGLGLFFLLGVVAELGNIQRTGNIGGEGTAALDVSAHGEKHTAYVRVHDNGVGCLVGVGCTCGGTALDTIQRISHSALIGTLSSGQTLYAHTQALIVHHGKHAGQAFVYFTDQPAFGAVKVHHTGSGCLDTHFVFDGAAAHGVALTQGAVFVDQELGNQKQGNTAAACRRIRKLGQHQVNNIFTQVMLTTGNEDLGTGHGISTVCLRLRLGTNDPQVGAGVRLGQTH